MMSVYKRARNISYLSISEDFNHNSSTCQTKLDKEVVKSYDIYLLVIFMNDFLYKCTAVYTDCILPIDFP